MEIPTLINANSTVKGEMILKTDSRVDGKIFGKVETDQTILIGKDGYFKGLLRARNLIVFGKIEGNILVSGETIFHSGSSIIGTLYTKDFSIKEGATINARIETFDESKTFEEAQSYMAEEMIRTETTNSLNNDNEIERILSTSTNQENVFEHVPSVLADTIVTISESYGEMVPAADSVSEYSGTYQFLNKQEEILIKPNGRHLIQTKRKKKALPQQKIREQTNDLDSKSFNIQNNEEKIITNPTIKSALFSSLLGNPVSGSSTFIYSNSENGEMHNYSASAQSENNNKESTVYGYNELRDLLIHRKFDMADPDERLNDRHRYNSKIMNGDELNKKMEGSDATEFIHSDSIRQLPT